MADDLADRPVRARGLDRPLLRSDVFRSTRPRPRTNGPAGQASCRAIGRHWGSPKRPFQPGLPGGLRAVPTRMASGGYGAPPAGMSEACRSNSQHRQVGALPGSTEAARCPGMAAARSETFRANHQHSADTQRRRRACEASRSGCRLSETCRANHQHSADTQRRRRACEASRSGCRLSEACRANHQHSADTQRRRRACEASRSGCRLSEACRANHQHSADTQRRRRACEASRSGCRLSEACRSNVDAAPASTERSSLRVAPERRRHDRPAQTAKACPIAMTPAGS